MLPHGLRHELVRNYVLTLLPPMWLAIKGNFDTMWSTFFILFDISFKCRISNRCNIFPHPEIEEHLVWNALAVDVHVLRYVEVCLKKGASKREWIANRVQEMHEAFILHLISTNLEVIYVDNFNPIKQNWCELSLPIRIMEYYHWSRLYLHK